MSNKDDGGPAFPQTPTLQWEATRGMSLRDWFAGMAMMGLTAKLGGNATAASAYRVANEMLEERKK